MSLAQSPNGSSRYRTALRLFVLLLLLLLCLNLYMFKMYMFVLSHERYLELYTINILLRVSVFLSVFSAFLLVEVF